LPLTIAVLQNQKRTFSWTVATVA